MKKTLIVLLLSVIATAIATAENGARPAASPDAVKPVTVGQTIPDVVVQNSKGEDVSLNKLIGEKKTALIFYRGGWCPFCNKHLKDVASIQADILKAGYQIVAVSTDRPEDVMKAEERGGYPFAILSDSDVSAAIAFGLAYRLDEPTAKQYTDYGIKLMDTAGNVHNSLPVPAFYLIEPDGTITFERHDADYKVRMTKDEILRAVGAR